ncbi:bifunctional phosphopantothenoylcysteine decarboxylase/phosphopantothenate--cysteine ligase CoaBC [Pelotomaculum terephthalicicum JT]|uniref:bifunctional phosphopantothenoylcysteine decarboxylase/phosphopantothenate--cysteine ligase CoaBC n=1 Tax=Pelotomaculum TaxID=191373 RepID=UPI0009CB6329|nr:MULTISPECIES: bifunctional phosphopantothenoylcysteine decarboxylase/phosphopantothenate--cysteine ligase CoaBC [Pelotomaculum]MCG9967628.1 bifunctional phosphopantothenoylcysteine decarboxylase/phosphopantothenate--cysteine ligase CoaBC [Pelotomaculum terephthalicicum JT]OPX84075.1 MAG: Coenzyme A biosynthesis bifunctional protein CoaBC [Pelotomaculum sp. PtaB.Bin117]OPY60160.1 MAG: Coenzyme A biosynthesis bifunctional protein CoaBC [Pelotomaculum sp. PtaU1.Bin065]
MLAGKNITVGITGGIAVFKVAQLVSNLASGKARVRVIMTRAAQEFVRPLTFQTLSGHHVYTDLFERPAGGIVQHIELATGSDLIVLAPATANVIGKAANGIADDLISTVVMAATCPVLICPAMNVNMYNNRVVQRNLSILRNLGYHFVDPGVGRLACGTAGRGRLAELDLIMDKINSVLSNNEDLRGLSVMVTAGPTTEPVDPVRYLTNRSSGKMGYAVADAAAKRGARVLLISGPVALNPPPGVEVIYVQTANEMYAAVMESFSMVDAVVMSAAVADYRPKTAAKQKIKKHESSLTIELEKNPDILAELGRKKKQQVLIGFAAETENLEKNAVLKVEGKNLDMLVANDVTLPGAGFGTDTNIAKLVFPGGRIVSLPKMDKLSLANHILDELTVLRKGEENNLKV